MKKNIRIRRICKYGVLGMPLGVTTGHVISILTSLKWGLGYYSPCVPQMIEVIGSEIGAVILQTVLCALLGGVFGVTSVIWENKTWSIMKQTGIYYLVDSAAMMLVAYLCYWMEHSARGFLCYFGIFTAIFVLVWLVQYMRVKSDLKKINSRLK